MEEKRSEVLDENQLVPGSIWNCPNEIYTLKSFKNEVYGKVISLLGAINRYFVRRSDTKVWELSCVCNKNAKKSGHSGKICDAHVLFSVQWGSDERRMKLVTIDKNHNCDLIALPANTKRTRERVQCKNVTVVASSMLQNYSAPRNPTSKNKRIIIVYSLVYISI